MSRSQAKISLRVHPNAAKSEVVDSTDRVLQIRVAAPPVKGKANQELIAFLSQFLGVRKSTLAIIRGHTSRSKLITIDGLSQQEAIKRLASKPSATSGNASR